MSNTEHPELRQEQRRVDEVVALIGGRIGKLRAQTGGVKSEIVDIRRNFWDDVTVNFEDAVETAETYASMKQQAELLSERERSHRHMEEQLTTLSKLEQNPYFGRIDLVEEGAEGTAPERIYLGIGSLLDDSGEQYLIYDWRAPVSGLYYDYGPGPVAYETPGGRIRGEMTLKRQYVIRGGVIRSMFDTGVTIGDELLQEVLGQSSDAQMRSIVATIQGEQNRIIRNERAKLLIVQGAAGSGKTSAALQRVAYLLYRYRGQLDSEQIVLFSPNPMFNSYVSTVLPELGEQNMSQTTYQQYLEHRLGRQFELEDPFAQMEYVLMETDEEALAVRKAGIAYKSGKAFMERIDAYVRQLGEAGLRFRDVKFRGRTLVSGQALADCFYSLEAGLSIPNRLRQLTSWLLKELTAAAKRERSKRWVEEAIELLDKEDYIVAYNELRRKNKFSEESFDDFKSEREYLAAQVVQQRFKKLRRAAKSLAYLDVPAIYAALFDGTEAGAQLSGVPDVWQRVSEWTLGQLAAGMMPYEDATPFLYLKEKLEGFHTNTTVKHLFIDEAQDYSAFQYHYLKRIFPNCRMTVLGDFNQTIFAHGETGGGFESVAELFDPAEQEQITLRRSYRSTRQIVEFTSRIIPGGESIVPFNRNGAEPEVVRAADGPERIANLAAKLRQWIERGFASVAIICKTAEESSALHRQLSPLFPQLRLIEKETVTFEKGIAVIPGYLAKGVEFDAVAIADASNDSYRRESERKLFYTSCTRAMHELYIAYTGELTPFLQPVSQRA